MNDNDMDDKYGLMQIPNDLEDTLHILDQLCILKLNLKICTLWKKRNVMKCNPNCNTTRVFEKSLNL